jgi:hypothetical protein
MRRAAIGAPATRLHAYRFVQKMRGGAQSTLVDTGEGCFVVKWSQNAQHRRVLINEAVCSELLRRLGVASPSWSWIHVDRVFLQNNPQIRIERPRGYTAIEPGWHFGSRYPVDPDREAVYDFLPSRIVEKVTNRWDFLKILVFDVWVDNRDQRQAVFFRSANRGLRVEMIDHGHALGFDGVEWCSSGELVRDLYPGTWALHTSVQAPERYDQAIAAIREVTREYLTRLCSMVPPEWIQDDAALLSRQFDRLIGRGLSLSESVAGARARILRPHPLEMAVLCR